MRRQQPASSLPDLADPALLFETALNALDEAVFLVTWPDRRIVRHNSAAERMFGLDSEALTRGDTRLLHVDEASYQEAGEKIAQSIDAGAPCAYYYRMRRATGETFPAENVVSPLRNPDGTIRGLVAVCRDLTRMRVVEEELELARRQIAESEKLAAMGSLVSGVAHEIRTPLAYLATNVYLLQQRLERAAQRQKSAEEALAELRPHIAEATEGVDRINRIVEELRRYTRLRRAPERSTLTPHEVTARAVDLFRVTHRGSATRVSTRLEKTRPAMLDGGQVQQVILNLLTNAAEAGAREILVATRQEDAWAEILVQDDGPGMTHEVQARMWEPLFTTKMHGTGLGLSIVRRIVEDHGGRIACESAPGNGTRFMVRFPTQ